MVTSEVLLVKFPVATYKFITEDIPHITIFDDHSAFALKFIGTEYGGSLHRQFIG